MIELKLNVDELEKVTVKVVRIVLDEVGVTVKGFGHNRYCSMCELVCEEIKKTAYDLVIEKVIDVKNELLELHPMEK